MKIFNFLRNSIFRLMGISPWDSVSGRMWFKLSKYVYFGDATSVICSLVIFCSVTAETFSEYIEAFFYIVICFLLISWLSGFLLNKNEHDELIGELEAIIEKRMKA